MAHLKNKILIITEGSTELGFLNRYISVSKSDNIEVVPFRQNIRELYNEMQEYIWGDSVVDTLAVLKSKSNISEEDLAKLNNKYTDIYLIFDLDIQNSKYEESLEKYLQNVEALVKFFNDSTSIGQILINYPMMESFRHIRGLKDVDYYKVQIDATIEKSKDYCQYLFDNKFELDYNNLTTHDFNLLAALNLKKANFIVNHKFACPDKFEYEDNLTQLNIFKIQKRNIIEEDIICVLNSALFFLIDLHGKNLFFSSRGSYLY